MSIPAKHTEKLGAQVREKIPFQFVGLYAFELGNSLLERKLFHNNTCFQMEIVKQHTICLSGYCTYGGEIFLSCAPTY